MALWWSGELGFHNVCIREGGGGRCWQGGMLFQGCNSHWRVPYLRKGPVAAATAAAVVAAAAAASWVLRHDVKTSSSSGCVYQGVDGTVVVRCAVEGGKGVLFSCLGKAEVVAATRPAGLGVT